MADQEGRAGQTTEWSNVLDITHPSRVKRNFNGWSHNLDLPTAPPPITVKTQGRQLPQWIQDLSYVHPV